ncbi:unnamed protein product [Closterium sp. Naga37s-1]|nr:unnamed protein product [Closterium sp. Naga37s-1]
MLPETTGQRDRAVAGGVPVGAAALGATEIVPAATEIAEPVGEAWAAAEAVAAAGGGSSSPFAMGAFAPPPAQGFGPCSGSGLGSGAVLSEAEEPAPPQPPRASTDAEGAEVAVTSTAACAGTPVAAVAASTREHGHAEDDRVDSTNGAASDDARTTSKKKLRAQPVPRRPGAGLGPGSPGPLLGWLWQE